MIEEDPLQCKQGMVLKMTSEKNCFIVCFREYVESLHQNSTQALLYGKVEMKVTCLYKTENSLFSGKNNVSVFNSDWPQPQLGYLSLHQVKTLKIHQLYVEN